MAAKTPLRAVTADEKAVTPARPATISEAANAGDTRALLVAMRTRIAATLQDPKCPPRDLASLSKRIIEIDESIKAIDVRDDRPRVEDEGGEAADEAFDAEAL